MKIQQLQSYNTHFYSKKQIPDSLRKGMANLKAQMEYESVMSVYKDPYVRTDVRGVNIDNKAVFKDGKFLARRNKKHQMVPYGKDTNMIEFEDVRLITKDNGEIIEYKKPFFTPWSIVFEKAEQLVKYAIDNYSDKQTIKKQTRQKINITPEQKEEVISAYNKLKSMIGQICPWK